MQLLKYLAGITNVHETPVDSTLSKLRSWSWIKLYSLPVCWCKSYQRLSAWLCCGCGPAGSRPRTRTRPRRSSGPRGCGGWRFSVCVRKTGEAIVTPPPVVLLISSILLTHPKETLPPVCLEWPLLIQLMVGNGWPDTWHSSSTRAPKGTVSSWGHSVTDGGAARERTHNLNTAGSGHRDVYSGPQEPTLTQHGQCGSSGAEEPLQLEVGGSAEVTPTVNLLNPAERTKSTTPLTHTWKYLLNSL